MIKTAIFVEGQTELILIREFLLKFFEYQNISIHCYTLFTDSQFIPTEYQFEAPGSHHYFQIINVGNDSSVLSRMLTREQNLYNSGFEKIIGLRDMYSRKYRELVKTGTIDEVVNEKFISSHKTQILQYFSHPERIFFQFAIMEVEAWLLGMYESIPRIDSRLTISFIRESLGIDLSALNPEKAFFHPSGVLDSIFRLIDRTYGKSKADVNSFVSFISREDFQYLNSCENCNSFSELFLALGLSDGE